MTIRCKRCDTVLVGDKKGTCLTCKCGDTYLDETEYYWRIGGDPDKIEYWEDKQWKNMSYYFEKGGYYDKENEDEHI